MAGAARSDTWVASSHPAVGNLASASQAAGAAGVRHTCTGISAGFSSDGTANGAAQNITLVLRDGATGAGTILMQWTIGRTTTTATDFINQGSFSITDLYIPGSAATAMTLEFIGTASNHELYTANLIGYDVG